MVVVNAGHHHGDGDRCGHVAKGGNAACRRGGSEASDTLHRVAVIKSAVANLLHRTV